jgi:acyl-CoA thioester hydrolase
VKIRFPVKTDIVVRFADVDVMGHVNNAVYLSYFEQARVAFFKRINKLDLRYMDAKSMFGFIVAEIGIKFLAPTFVDQALTVGIRVAEIRNKAFRFEYEIRDKKSKAVVATGFSVQVCYNYKTHKTFPMSDGLRRKMAGMNG